MTAERIRVVIADDETAARSRIRKLLRDTPGYEVVAEARNGPDTVAAVRRHRPDLLFLDVQMPGFDGFEVLAQIEPEILPAIAFVTAYDQYALRAFEAHAVDYLLKPFDDERFADALAHAGRCVGERRSGAMQAGLRELIARARAGIALAAAQETPEAEGWRRIAIRQRDTVLLVDVDSVDWIEAAGDYACLHAPGKRYLAHHSLAELERRLDVRFVRVHRSAIVRRDAVAGLSARGHGDYDVRLRDGTVLRLSRTHREAFARALGVAL